MEIEIAWIIDDVLAQSSYPHPRHFDNLYKKGIRAIVSLEKRPDKNLIKKKKIEYLEVYVEDFTAPNFDQLARINKFIDAMARKNKPVLVHCFAGGRSGTAIVSYLIHRGMPFDNALENVRRRIPGAVETPEQIQTLKEYETIIRRSKGIRMFEEKHFITNPWYLQTDKINSLRSIPPSREGILDKIKGKVNVKIKVKISLMEIDIEGRNREDEVIYHKLKELIEESDKENNLLNLNNCKRADFRSKAYVYFSGKAVFESHKEDPEIVNVRGKSRKFDFVCNCSKKYFTRISSSLFRTIMDAKELIKDHNLDICLIGRIVQIPRSPEELLLLDALYIGGHTEDIHSIYKSEG